VTLYGADMVDLSELFPGLRFSVGEVFAALHR
jgi:hypothetical protein